MIRFWQILCVAVVSFIAHFMWEMAHIGLYTGYEHITRLPITLYATIGDVVYVLIGVLLVSLFKRSFAWFDTPNRGDFIALAVIGFLIALFVEYKGLMLGRWVYTDAMPIVPLLNVGLSPLVQMTILLPLSVWISSKIYSVRM